MTDWKQLELMFEVAEKEFGEIDIVCPGAGVYEPVGFFHSFVNQSASCGSTPPFSALSHCSHAVGCVALEQLLAPTRYS